MLYKTDVCWRYIWIAELNLLRTIFKGLPRHNYIDPDYAYTADQANVNQRHKQYYIDFIKELGQNRINKLTTRLVHSFICKDLPPKFYAGPLWWI